MQVARFSTLDKGEAIVNARAKKKVTILNRYAMITMDAVLKWSLILAAVIWWTLGRDETASFYRKLTNLRICPAILSVVHLTFLPVNCW